MVAGTADRYRLRVFKRNDFGLPNCGKTAFAVRVPLRRAGPFEITAIGLSVMGAHRTHIRSSHGVCG
jgi:hypothetical protein